MRALASTGLLALLLAGSQTGCALVSPLPTWELVKAAGAATSTAIAYGPGRAVNTVHHGDAPPRSVCIEYNREVQMADLVPALQAELRELRISSRVYSAGTAPPDCETWLRYAASIQWDIPPLAEGYRAYVNAATLSLHKLDGRLIAHSSYALDGDLRSSKWASTRRKLAPVVKAVITGFES
ncbi:cell division protein FtsI [Paucibacter sp. M5-1]|uniref:cell division protein FtsI n=1 Tax=Paucibacter sp. M5-1 TaxID=3015998 RepID=UPI0022B93186|nr:cell division protein FtsI [Paucibacter sp. M5-1]MCZ7883194.1 cell division protein FtsI [Paucibacter sp. M5-1]